MVPTFHPTAPTAPRLSPHLGPPRAPTGWPDSTPTTPYPPPDPTPTAPRPRPAPTPAPSSLRKKISALNARKKAAAAQEKLDDAKGLPKWNLFRVLPKQTAGNTRGIDGSLRFPKPWGKQWGSQGLTDDGEKRV